MRGVEERVIEAVMRQGATVDSTVPLGPGDDMAMLAVGREQVLVAADQVVEGIHFAAGTPLALVAHKAIARNASDVAAMAGIPVATLACASLPSEMTPDEAEALVVALVKEAGGAGCPLVGGDTCVHRREGAPLSLAVTILARARKDGIVVRRDGAVAGDRIIVSGPLGGSFGKDGMGRHLRFTPRLSEAHALVDTLGARVHAMIDVSDGLGIDVARVMHASSGARGAPLVAHLDAHRIPIADGSSLEGALRDGEDHELVAVIDASAPVPPTWIEIGSVVAPVDPRGVAVFLITDGEASEISKCGWTHGNG